MLPDSSELPEEFEWPGTLPTDVTWNGDAFTLTVPNTHTQPEPNEIRVEKRWVDSSGQPAAGTRDVKVQLRRYMPNKHDVTVRFYSEGWQNGGTYEPAIDESRVYRSITGNEITIEFTRPNRWSQDPEPPVTCTVGTVTRKEKVNDKWRIVVSGVTSDTTVTIDYSGWNWQLKNQNNNPPIQNTVTVNGNGQSNNDYVPDPGFPETGDAKATQILSSTNGYTYTWTIGDGSGFDYPLGNGAYKYYIVELDDNNQPITPNPDSVGGLLSITDTDGVTTGIITATNRINGSLKLQKLVSAPLSGDMSHADGAYNFTVTGPSGTKHVQIRANTEGGQTKYTYKVSDAVIPYEDMTGFNDVPEGGVVIGNLIAGEYTVKETGHRLIDQSGNYDTELEQIEIGGTGTVELANELAKLNVLAENTPSASATFTNMLVPRINVPVVKKWNWSPQDAPNVKSWTAKFNLEYREVLVSGDAASDAQHNWAPVYGADGTTQQSVEITSTTDEGRGQFDNLPMYKTHSNGSVYRIIYAVDEVSYTITWNNNTTETWPRETSEHLVEHYAPDYEQDAGELDQPDDPTGYAEWYTIKLTNVKTTREIEKTIDLSLEKVWEDEELHTDTDSYAKFRLMRTYHEEYLDYNKDGRNLTNQPEVTVTMQLDEDTTKELVVPKTAPVYITGVVKPGKTVILKFEKGDETIFLSGGSADSTGQQFITTTTAFAADDVTVRFVSGNVSDLVGGLDGIGLASFDEGDTTAEKKDTTFNKALDEGGQAAGQVFTLSSADGWQKDWVNLPQVVEEKTVNTENGHTLMKTIVYSYYLEEVEAYPKNYEVSFTGDQGDEHNPMISSGSLVAVNRLKTTEFGGTKTWRLAGNSMPAAPILKLTRTFTTTEGEGATAVTTTSPPEPVTVRQDDEDVYLQPTWSASSENPRTYTYKDLPAMDADGNPYSYSVEEISFTLGTGEDKVTYTAMRQTDGSYIVTADKEGVEMYRVTQDGNDIVNELTKTKIEILKIDEDTRNTTRTVLTGATFRLLMHNGDAYTTYFPNPDYSATDGIPVSSDGTLSFVDLPDGEYVIKEKYAPEGYIKVEDNDIYFKIEGGVVTRYDKPLGAEDRRVIPESTTIGDSTVATVVAAISYISDSASSTTFFTVGNTHGAVLPYTGGIGTNIFYFIGAVLTVLAGAGILMRRRRQVA